MAVDFDSRTPSPEPVLPPDFTHRLEQSLTEADQARGRRKRLVRATAVLPVVLLVGPLIGWRLMLASPDGVHVTIAALAWLTFMLDVGVHVDTVVLSYVHLTALPSVVGVFLLAVLAYWLLGRSEGVR